MAQFLILIDLAATCKVALLNPGDQAAHDKMLEAASHLQSVNQQMVADAGKVPSHNVGIKFTIQ
jgi:hypothetical protein